MTCHVVPMTESPVLKACDLLQVVRPVLTDVLALLP